MVKFHFLCFVLDGVLGEDVGYILFKVASWLFVFIQIYIVVFGYGFKLINFLAKVSIKSSPSKVNVIHTIFDKMRQI